MSTFDRFLFSDHIDSHICREILHRFQQHLGDHRGSWDQDRGYWCVNLFKIEDPGLVSRYLTALGLCLERYHQSMSQNEPTLQNWFSAQRNIEPVVNLQYFPPGSSYRHWHHERTLDSPHRVIAFMTYLNDVDTGGETEFLYQNIRVKPQQGSTLFWPADYTHIHRGSACDQEKYTMTGWIQSRGCPGTMDISELSRLLALSDRRDPA